MTPLPIRSAVFVCALFFLGSAKPHPSVPPASVLTNYYWYDASTDTYDTNTSTENEIARLENTYGVLVDTSPSGGTALRNGFINNQVPHNVWPTVILYGHF